MFPRVRSRAASACALALVAAAAGFTGAQLAAQDRAATALPPVQNHAADAKPHLQMAQDPDGAAMLKQSMAMMLAHQNVLHDLQDHPETKQLLAQAAKDPKVAALLQQVKTEMSDPQKRSAKVAEVKKDHKEMMMVLAHALMRQDPELKRLMKEDHEAGKH